MKIIQFTIPVTKEYSIIVQDDKLPHFYNHLHRHNETQITWVIKGEGTLIVGNCMQRFKPGDIYIIGANQPHLFKSDPLYFEKNNGLEVQALTLFVDTMGMFSNILELPEMKNVKRFLEVTKMGLQVPELYQRRVADKMLRIKEAKNCFRLASFINLLPALTAIKKYKTLSNTYTEYTISESGRFTYERYLSVYDDALYRKHNTGADLRCCIPYTTRHSAGTLKSIRAKLILLS